MFDYRITAQAPSNIALVKYMGKLDSSLNLPTNSSLSMTLQSLCSFAELTVTQPGEKKLPRGHPQGHTQVLWLPEIPQGIRSRYPAVVPPMDDRGLSRVYQHLNRVQKAMPTILQNWELESAFSPNDLNGVLWTLRTANTFPAASGIASSASSFAAMTLVASAACAKSPLRFEQIWLNEPKLRSQLAELSRQGSGSSCRSFEGPWVQWSGHEAKKVDSMRMPSVAHFVVLIKTEPKAVSSSEAHRRIQSSPLWQGRVERVEERLVQVKLALQNGDWDALAKLTWVEAWEMHSLFHTSSEPFSYWEAGTMRGLQWLSGFLSESTQEQKVSGDSMARVKPPVVTLDAGPNIHILVEEEMRDFWRQKLKEFFSGLRILEDQQGKGPTLEIISR